MRYLMVCGALAVAACSSGSGPTPLGGGEYMITRDNEYLASTAQNKVVAEANAHCASLGQVVEPGAATPIFGYYSGFSLRYRCRSA